MIAHIRLRDLPRIARAHGRQMTPWRRRSDDAWVLLFPAYKIAYIPVPKAANSSIRSELLRLHNIDPDTIPQVQAFDGFEKRRFSRCAAKLSPDWLVFTAVRDPYSRAVSAYFNKLKLRGKLFGPLKTMGLRQTDSLERFLSLILVWPRKARNDHFMPQSCLLSEALKLPHLKIMKLESLAGDWHPIAAEIERRSGIEMHPLGHRNSGRDSGLRDTVHTEAARSLIERIYADDFGAFGYPVDQRRN